MKQFFAKIYVQSAMHQEGRQVVLKTFAENSETAESNIDRIIDKWDNVNFYEIQKITTKPIQLERYLIFSELKYSTGKTKNLKFHVKGEDKKDSEIFFRKLIGEWKQVVSVQINEIVKQF